MAEHLLDRMLESYFTNVERYLGVVGDYIDRGPLSKGVVDYIIRLKNVKSYFVGRT